MANKESSFRLGRAYKDELGFCRVEFITKVDDSMTNDDARQICEAIVAVCNGEPHKILTDARDTFGSVESGSREIIRNHKELMKVRKAEAFVVNSLSNKLTANFYMKFNKPPNPTRVFNDIDSAITWLKSFD